MISIGLLLCQALAIAVTQSVTPGPAVTTPTPQRRVARDQPSAACPATCSCRTSITFTFSSMAGVVDRLHVPAAEREDRIDAFLLDRAHHEVAAVYHGHGAAPSGISFRNFGVCVWNFAGYMIRGLWFVLSARSVWTSANIWRKGEGGKQARTRRGSFDRESIEYTLGYSVSGVSHGTDPDYGLSHQRFPAVEGECQRYLNWSTGEIGKRALKYFDKGEPFASALA